MEEPELILPDNESNSDDNENMDIDPLEGCIDKNETVKETCLTEMKQNIDINLNKITENNKEEVIVLKDYKKRKQFWAMRQ